MRPQSDDPDGFWESQPIVNFNERLLKSADRSWMDPCPIELGWFKDRYKRLERIEQAKILIEQEFPKGDLLVLKDPRICRLLPIWLDAFKQSKIDVCSLIICRNPLEVSASLAKRNQTDSMTNNMLWLEYMLTAERHTRELPRAIIHYADLLSNWRDVLSQAVDELNLDPIELSGTAAESIDQFLSQKKQHHKATTDDLLKGESYPTVLKKTWVAFQTQPKPSTFHFESIQEEYLNLSRNINYHVNRQKQTQLNNQESKIISQEAEKRDAKNNNMTTPKEHRHIILHYHLFKNAGTSVDKILKDNFKDAWCEHEGPNAGWKSEDVGKFLEQNPDIQVLSSHTALLPVPTLPNTTIYPIIFVRHPIDRVRSVYEFERKQIAETEGSIKAKELDLPGYVEWRLSRKRDRTIRDFHAHRFSFLLVTLGVERKALGLKSYLDAIDQLPFIGVVEFFEESLLRCQAYLQKEFKEIVFESIKLNSTQDKDASLESRLQYLELSLGKNLHKELIEANKMDLELYEHISKDFTG